MTGEASQTLRSGLLTGGARYSRPLDQLIGNGKNMKYVKACTELHLAKKGFERLRDFDSLVNLEVLWVNGNSLRYIDGLDNNFRIKSLYAHDNQICTLKGSLHKLMFLDTLDLANNQLRDLFKILDFLEKFKFLRHLNLKGNPCCEEPEYRLNTIYKLPGLKVLDNHEVSEGERSEALSKIGGDNLSLTVAFGQRAPQFYGPWNERVPERSRLELDLVKTAEKLQERQAVEDAKGDDVFKTNLFPRITGASLPPPPGWSELEIPPAGSKQWEDAFFDRQAEVDATIAAKSATVRERTAPSHAHAASYKPRDIFHYQAIQRMDVNIDTQQKAKGRARFQGGGGIDIDKELFQRYAERIAKEAPGRLVPKSALI